MSAMNPLAELDQLNLEPAAKIQVTAMLQALIDQQVKDAQLIHAKDVKIAALTHELAYYKRIRFATRSEALAPLQRDVFEETWNTDVSAIEAEVERLADTEPCTTVAKPKRLRAGRQPLPAHLPRIEPCPELVEGIATNPSPAPAANAAGTWSRPVLSLSKYRRRYYRATGCRAGQVFRASAPSSAIHLPGLRNRYSRADSAGRDRRRPGGAGFADLGDDQ